MLALLTLRLTDPLVPHPRGRPRSLDPGTGTARYGRPGRSPAFPGRTAPDHGLRHPLPTDHRSACSAKFNYLALSVVFLCPLILLFLLASPDTGHILSFGILILGGALLLLYLKESLMLFLSKKFRFCIGFCTFVPSKFFP